MMIKSNLIVDLLFHLILCPIVYSPSSFITSNAQPLKTSDSFLSDYYMDSGGDSSATGARDAYGDQLSKGYAGSGYQTGASSAGRYSSGNKGHQSHLSSSNHKQSDGSLKHSEGSIEAEKDRVVKHQWDRGGGYVKEWNWDKGVHYEKESGSVSASDLKHKESEKSRQSGEKSKGSAGWQQHENKDHEKWKASNGWGKEGYRNEGANKYADRYGSSNSNRQNGYNKYGSALDDPWSLKGDYLPLKAAASSQPHGLANQPKGFIRIPQDYLRRGSSTNGWSEKPHWRSKNEYNDSLRELIEKKYMPIYRKYSIASRGEKNRGKSRYDKNKQSVPHFADLRLALSKEFLKPQGRWKLGHLFGNGLDAFSPSNQFVWH